MNDGINGYAVIGASFGDEGKGLVTDFICSTVKDPIVIRFSGGQQAGHTVSYDGKRHVFSNFGSGTMRGVPTYWAPTCTFDPVGMMRELDILLGMGVTPKLYVDETCPLTTPYDKWHNCNIAHEHGTCGVGVGSTIDREERMYSLLVGDLRSEFVFRSKLDAVRVYYEGFLKKPPVTRIKIGTHVGLHLNKSELEFYCALRDMLDSPHVKIVSGVPDSSVGKNRVFEGSQGLMLDPSIGVFPHVTRIPVSSYRTLCMYPEPTVFLVTRAYVTRHGDGPMPNEDLPHNIKADPDETNVLNKWQGPLRIGLLDLDVLKYAMGRDSYLRGTTKKVLVVTCLDHVTGDYRYTSGGDIVQCSNEEEFVGGIAKALGFDVVYVSHGPAASDVTSFKTKL